jgi:hypothetical protein
MATVKYSESINEIKGKVGNSVFQRFGMSFGIRSMVYNAFSRSNEAVEYRLKFTTIANAWSTLSAAQKSNWVMVSSSYPAFDRFGNPIKLTGFQVFMQVNLMCFSAGLNLQTAAYFYGQLIMPGVFVGALHVNTSNFEITVNSPEYMLGRYVVYATGLYTPASVDKNPKLVIVNNYSSFDGAPHNIYSRVAEIAREPIVIGKSIYVEIWLIDGATGIQGKVYGAWVQTVI